MLNPQHYWQKLGKLLSNQSYQSINLEEPFDRVELSFLYSGDEYYTRQWLQVKYNYKILWLVIVY